MEAPPEILKVRGLRVSFGGRVVLRDLELDLERTKAIALMGANGSGKTTLLNVLSGFLQPNSGSVLHEGESLVSLRPHAINSLGICRTFQEVRLAPRLTVLQTAMLASNATKTTAVPWQMLRAVWSQTRQAIAREDAVKALRRVGLEAELGQFAGRLSFGQKKLLGLACAIASRAKLILLDEPAAGLSAAIISNVIDALRGLKETGRTLLFVEHDHEFVREVSDEVLVLCDGTVAIRGPFENVIHQEVFRRSYGLL